MTSQSGWDRQSGTYEKWAMPVSSAFASRALDLLGPAGGGSLLDVATGTGALAGLAADAGWRVSAIDNAPEMIAYAADRLAPFKDAIVVAMDALRLDFGDDTFDIVASVFGATILGGNTGRAIREMWRVVKPGGRVVIVHWNLPQGAPTFNILFRVLAHVYDDPALLSYGLGLLRADELAAAMTDVGIQDVRTRLLEVDALMPEPDRAVDELHTMFSAHQLYRDLDAEAHQRVRVEYARVIREARAAGRGDADRATAHIAIGRKG